MAAACERLPVLARLRLSSCPRSLSVRILVHVNCNLAPLLLCLSLSFCASWTQQHKLERCGVSVCCNCYQDGPCRVLFGTGSATKLVVLLIRLGSSSEQSERIWLRMGTLGLLVAFLPVACVGISWSRLLEMDPGTSPRHFTLAGQLRLGLGVSSRLTTVTSSSVLHTTDFVVSTIA